MKERPILFSAPMVKAIMEGRKTQTRRVVKYPCGIYESDPNPPHELRPSPAACPYGAVGDRLWVKEAWRPSQVAGHAWYAADGEDAEHARWKSSLFMPRWASRITLEITGIRVTRVQEISKADCIAEGMTDIEDIHAGWHQSYAQLWQSINGKKHPWESNPWVWVIEFRRVKP